MELHIYNHLFGMYVKTARRAATKRYKQCRNVLTYLSKRYKRYKRVLS